MSEPGLNGGYDGYRNAASVWCTASKISFRDSRGMIKQPFVSTYIHFLEKSSKDQLTRLKRISFLAAAEGRIEIHHTLTNLDSRCPRSLLKTAPPPPGYPQISGGRYVTPEPRFSGLVLDYQVLEELELKNHPKTAVFGQIWLFFERFVGYGSFKS